MNSSLPSMLEAIFGKKDLGSVSLDEMYEVINEFPSFNAAHFLLSKKLKEINDAAYEKVSLRTALYFNNPFWLQSMLEDGSRLKRHHFPDALAEERKSPSHQFAEPAQEPVQIIFEEEIESDLSEDPVQLQSEFQNPENINGTVTSFDELISKYQVESDQVTNEPAIETVVVAEIYTGFIPETGTDTDFVDPDEMHKLQTETNPDQYEISEEVLNEYGIFEEVKVKKPDIDLESFDRPIEINPDKEESISSDNSDLEIIELNLESGGEFSDQDDSREKTSEMDFESFDRPMETTPVKEEYITSENPDLEIVELNLESNSEISDRDKSLEKIPEMDYGAFDRPFEKIEPAVESEEMETNLGSSSETEVFEADNTGESDRFSGEQADRPNDEIEKMTARFREQQQARAAFDPKRTESIVFAPYHMIDYFASQGIKLVMEDNPPDSFGKQLKSFTDWLKVMKKLPVQPANKKTDEKESERIRHFAAHSIEERDVLTESMAEVLAKQGMYENAIAIYQKLSLIYPPKSAYFASRIEQIKAALP